MTQTKNSDNNSKQRVRIERQGDLIVYSAGFWPGWSEVLMLLVAFLVVSWVFAVVVAILYQFSVAYAGIEPQWLNTLLAFIFGPLMNIAAVAGLGFLVLWIPYFLIYQLSPKRFWIENNTLVHRVRLLGFIPNNRRIPFERILNIETGQSGRRHHISVLYERNLPKWLFVIIVYWNEKLTQWPLTLVNAIPTLDEARRIQTALLEPMTASPTCRVGTTPDTAKKT